MHKKYVIKILLSIICILFSTICLGQTDNEIIGSWTFKDVVLPLGMDKKEQEEYTAYFRDTNIEFSKNYSYKGSLMGTPESGKWKFFNKQVELTSENGAVNVFSVIPSKSGLGGFDLYGAGFTITKAPPDLATKQSEYNIDPDLVIENKVQSQSAQKDWKTYTNKTFEISVDIPALWREGKPEGFDPETILDNKQRTAILEKEGSIYLVNFFEAYTILPKKGPSPKIQINAVYKPEVSFEEFKKEAIRSADKLDEYLDNFKYIRHAEEIIIAEIKSIHFEFSYTMVVEGKKVELRNHTYAIPFHDFLFHISMVDGLSHDSKQIFENFSKTIKIGY